MWTGSARTTYLSLNDSRALLHAYMYSIGIESPRAAFTNGLTWHGMCASIVLQRNDYTTGLLERLLKYAVL